ncbi:MAG: efflux RND transporter permease subunit [Bacteroidetes bacterium]|nr:efflux RND transporter permease subunit [Bacteroidota bacterium]
MKKILSLFVKYPFYGEMFIIILLLLGSISYINMHKATFPLIESKVISVSVAYPGATPKEMDEGITALVENSIRGIPGIKEFTSKSRESSARISITALAGYNMDELLRDVKNAVDGISNFPASAERPIVSKGRTKDMAIFVGLTSESSDILKINSMANRIEDDLLATGKISQITIYGVPNKLELAIELDETQMRRYNLTFSEIQTAISSNNIDIAGGTIRNPREQIKIICRNRSVNPKDIREIVLKTNINGNVLTIGDVATVKLQVPEDPTNGYNNKKPTVTLFVQKLVNEDLEAISNIVNDYIINFNKTHDDYKMRVKMDFLELIDSQLSILTSNGILGVIIVILLLSLLLNIRLSLWVAWGIPASFLGMFIVANLMGVTINLISLFGMILIIGILVDDGVVIGENIFTHFEMGKSPRRAAIDGTLEVLPAVFTSVTTTIIAFTPLFFIQGHMEMMYEMAIVVVIALIFSLLESVFVLPGHLANTKVLKKNTSNSFYGKLRKKIDKLIFGLRDKIYAPFLNWVLKHKTISISSIIGMFIITFALVVGGIIPFTFFPQTPSDMFTVDLALKPGVNEQITKNKLFYIEDKIWEVNSELMKKNNDTLSYIKSIDIGMGNAFNGTESGSNAGKMRIFLNPLESTQVTDEILKKAISQKIGRIPEAYKFAVGASNRFGAPVSISLLGYNEDDLESAKNELEAELEKMPALFNITNNSQIGSQELRLKLKPEAYALGLTNQSLMMEVRQGFYGGLAQRIQEGKDEIWVYVRYSRKNRKNIGQLENMLIHTKKGNYSLGRIADISTARSLSTINHFNGKREIRVDAYQKNQTQSVPDILDYIEAEILPTILEKHKDVSFMHQGQRKDTSEQMQSLILYFGLAFLIIVLVIMIYFKSFRQGLLVIAMMPLGIMGAIWGHGFHGQSISMMSLWGIVALSGVVINDAIVFLAKYNQNLEKGMTILNGIKDAGMSRFRAIFLTTLTTTAGLMPLILENSPDARMLIPMAISLAYGIMFGTVFILIILPVFVVLSNKVAFEWKKICNKQVSKPEDVETAVINLKIEQALSKNMSKEFE